MEGILIFVMYIMESVERHRLVLRQRPGSLEVF